MSNGNGIRLRIVLERPPSGVDFGLQKGKGAKYEIEQKQRSNGGDLTFEFDVLPGLRGPFVQGPPAVRFVYIGIGSYAGQTDSAWSRRLKVPLDGLDPAATGLFETRVPGTGRDGGPNCATVKPFSGWNRA